VCTAIITSNANVVFTHSMGNLAFAAGMIETVAGKATYAECVKLKARYPKQQAAPSASYPKLEADEIAWISIQGPFHFSVAADACKTVCASNDPLWIPVQKLPIACACPNHVMTKSTASLETTYQSSYGVTSAAMSSLVAKAAFAVVCGLSTDATGGLADEIALKATKLLATLGGQSWGSDSKTSTTQPLTGCDGLVAFTSCRGDIASALFKLIASSRYYAGLFNHGSGTCRDGQQKGGTDQSKEPVTAYTNAAKEALNSRQPPAATGANPSPPSRANRMRHGRKYDNSRA